ncbi:hypothetical protein MNV49_006537 [Pseudohyphozyma bogoriensis]|nr:hypothetical protein MNV49_006537 [Pseudohyphozyma bogoriensis]
MPSVSTTTTTVVSPAEVGSLHLRGSAEQTLIAGHSAVREAAIVRPDGLRTDREYRDAYEGGNPEGWPETRGVPPYRPLDRNLDQTNRPWAGNPAEIMFVRTMLTGVAFIGLGNWAWRSTVGKLTNGVWTYPVGGQY